MALKELRIALQLSQKELAAKLSVDQANVSQIENRTRYVYINIEKLYSSHGW